MSGKKRILLVLDFTGGNFPNALHTLQQWSQYASHSQKYEIVLGPTTFAHRSSPIGTAGSLSVRDAVMMIAHCCPGITTVYWDRYVDQIALEVVRRNRVSSQPFYMDFNYGSVVNRSLLLANEMSCDYLLRIDPGTHPRKRPSFDKLVEEHVSLIDRSQTDVVISRGYKGRLAIRDIFLIAGMAEEHYRLIKRMTGVDPQDQVTGGAMFTSRVPGTPAIPFDKSKKGLTLVWGSDDAFFQLVPSTRGSHKIGTRKVPRFDIVGKPKTTIEYYRGVAGMVALASLLQGHGTPGMAAEQVDQFLSSLVPLLHEKKCRDNDGNERWRESFTRENIAPDEFIEQIARGWENYKRLRTEWKDICEILKGQLYPYVQLT